MQHADVVIAGAGTIGMALALELRQRGRGVLLLEHAAPGAGASSAAAGMLAAHDPANPPELQPLADLSEQLYPAFLQRLAPARPVRLQTSWTLERTSCAGTAPLPAGVNAEAGPFHLLREWSLDPRELVAALTLACTAAGVELWSARLNSATARSSEIHLDTTAGALTCTQFVDTTGAWGRRDIRPVKGQMLRLQLGSATPTLPGRGPVVLRTPSVYIVPRLNGSALVGATVEERGFSLETEDEAIADLRRRAAELLAAAATAPELERWAGLRPATPDGLPLLGPRPGAQPATPPGTCFVATGHYRNGILLAPATAHVMAQLLHGEEPDVPLAPFAPDRFTAPSSEHRATVVTIAPSTR